MSTIIRDLWPDDIKSEKIISPEAILDYQADRLNERTKGLLSAHVVRLAGEDRVVLGFEVESRLADRRVRLFAAQHRLEFEYPVALMPPDTTLPAFLKERFYVPSGEERRYASETASATAYMKAAGIVGEWVENKWVASSPTEFSRLVQDMLAQPAVKATVLSLLPREDRERPAEDANQEQA
jgi:hypothetical protein